MGLLNDVKKDIENITGVPASLLTGETVEENIAQAKAILAYKQQKAAEDQAQAPKTTQEEFAAWCEKQFTVQYLN